MIVVSAIDDVGVSLHGNYCFVERSYLEIVGKVQNWTSNGGARTICQLRDDYINIRDYVVLSVAAIKLPKHKRRNFFLFPPSNEPCFRLFFPLALCSGSGSLHECRWWAVVKTIKCDQRILPASDTTDWLFIQDYGEWAIINFSTFSFIVLVIKRRR